MALSKFKNSGILRATKKLLQNKNTSSSLQISNSIKSVGIIVTEGSDFNFDMLKYLQKEISLNSSALFVLTCKKTKENYNEFRGVTIQEQDFTWNGSLKSPEVHDFLNKKVDMLIDLTNNSEVYTNFLVAKSKAKFKVGFAHIDDRLFDLMIDVTSTQIFLTELVKYLTILKKI